MPREANSAVDIADLPPYGNGTLPAGIRSRSIANVNGLGVHILEAGEADRPALLLLHGFPELAYCPSPLRAITLLRRTSAAMAAPPDGTDRTTPIPILSACSTWCATRWRWYSRSGTARSPP